MIISTESYEFAHGKRPRGYGLWAFKINGSLEFFQGTYGNTVKMAKEYAREILRDNTAVIKVQP